MTFFIIFIIGGISLFLIGLSNTKDSLYSLNSISFKKIISKLTNKNISSFFIGILLTAIIQSSSGITAITIVFLSTNILSFKSAALIILGSNIGTCITPFIFTLNIDSFSLIIIAIGYILSIIKQNKVHIIGNIIISLGLIFLGLNFLNYGLSFLEQNIIFSNILKNTKTPFLAIIISSLIATILQSSSATIAITQSLYQNNLINLQSGLGFMLGANIGTCIATYILALSSSKESKLAIKVNIIFNIIGAVVFFVFLNPFSNFLLILENKFNIEKDLIIAYSHLIFNIVSTLIVFVFFDKFLILCTKKFLKVDTNT